MKKIKFSFIIPVYNCERYLGECLDSILKQDYADYEIILIDDGSQDESEKVYLRYKKLYPEKIRIIKQTNKGQFLARRRGIDIAGGKFVLFIDADDYIAQDTLSTIRDRLDREELDIIVFEFERVDDEKRSLGKLDLKLKNNFIWEENKEEIFNLILEGNSFNNLCNKVIKLELLKNINFDEEKIGKCRNGEDLFQLLPAITNCRKITYINKVLYFYRSNLNSVTANFNEYFYESCKYINGEIGNYIQLWGGGEKRNLFNNSILESIYSFLIGLYKKNCLLNSKEKHAHILRISNDIFFTQVYSNSMIEKNKRKIVFNLLSRKKLSILKVVLKVLANIDEFKNLVKKFLVKMK